MKRANDGYSMEPEKICDTELRASLCESGPKMCANCETGCGYGREWLRRTRDRRRAAEKARVAAVLREANETRAKITLAAAGFRRPAGKPGYHRWTAQERERMLAEVKKGRLARDVGLEMGVSEQAVYNQLKMMGFGRHGAPRGRMKKWTTKELEQIIRLARDGLNSRQIGDEIGRSKQSVYQALKRHAPGLLWEARLRRQSPDEEARVCCEDCMYCATIEEDGTFTCALIGKELCAPDFRARDFWCRNGQRRTLERE